MGIYEERLIPTSTMQDTNTEQLLGTKGEANPTSTCREASEGSRLPIVLKQRFKASLLEPFLLVRSMQSIKIRDLIMGYIKKVRRK